MIDQEDVEGCLVIVLAAIWLGATSIGAIKLLQVLWSM